MDDLISRQAAVDAIHEDADWLAAQGSDWQVERMERDKSILMSLPSAEKVQLSGEDATFDCISRQATIDVEGLDEQIRCEMCRNPMHTNRGCEGNCKYDEKLYERIMQILGERIKPLPSAETDLSTYSDKLWKIAYERGRKEGRKKGKWIFIHPLQADDEGAYICSNCHRGDWDIKPTDKYCKFCEMEMDIYERQRG